MCSRRRSRQQASGATSKYRCEMSSCLSAVRPDRGARARGGRLRQRLRSRSSSLERCGEGRQASQAGAALQAEPPQLAQGRERRQGREALHAAQVQFLEPGERGEGLEGGGRELAHSRRSQLREGAESLQAGHAGAAEVEGGHAREAAQRVRGADALATKQPQLPQASEGDQVRKGLTSLRLRSRAISRGQEPRGGRP